MHDVFSFLAVICSGVFAGAAIYINAVEHPARMTCGARVALQQWDPSYARATVMQASLAVIGCLFAILAWLTGASMWFLPAGLILLSVAPYTLVVVMPTNKRLQALGPDSDDAEIARLLQRWNVLHGVRSALGFVAFAWLVALA
ncbi:hypothetical protein GCM10007160_16630 [Litchfieldella qijiaojingensis]|uniref:DUF1772 domain-containing protein n=1 Tax=Litchfieldella qijiaojingensis TaxID=980347 RepID=A0ABQ2YPR8_9GAMM|nr:DUF1772 domain-containing protein [Halomonas qijiaojingensis]GGX89890.1 hypothetical protein GCM10007160_16630 [Halomonas qijiaojingensis]